MNEFDIDSVMKIEDKQIDGLISESQLFDTKFENKVPVCSSCGKDKILSRTASDKDLRRWQTKSSSDTIAYFRSSSRCDCSNRLESRKKYDSSKVKRKGHSDVPKSDLNSGKDFIAHNIRTCNSYRFRDSYVAQNINDFVHYKNTNDYINQYRQCKLEKLEKSTYQIDQSIFNEEMTRSLSNSLSNLIGKISLDEKTTKDVANDFACPTKDLKLKDSDQKIIQYSHSFSEFDSSQQQSMVKHQSNKDAETCTRCGDKLKRQDLLASISNGIRLEQKFPLRMTHEKFDDKKLKKLIKRTSDHRQRMIIEKPASVINRPELEQTFNSELQPFCQQMPIKNNIFLEKRSNLKRDDWRGHPSSTKPRFSDRMDRISEESRKSQTATVRKKSLENMDIFNCYGEKYRLLKEST